MTAVPDDMPRDFCGLGLSFEIDRVDYEAPETAGTSGGVQAGFPRWSAVWPIGTIGRRKSDEVRAFVSARRGAQVRFYGYEPGREIPRFHQGGIPFSATPSGWSQAVGDDGRVRLTLEGVMPGMVLSHGDYIGFIWDEWKRALVRAMSLASAQDDGTIIVVIEPAVPLVVPVDAAVTLSHPTCIMRLDGKQTQLGGINRRLAVAGGKIVAHQELVA